MYCNQCGHRNPAGANFCSSCGAPLEPAPEDTTMTFVPVTAAGEVIDEEISVSVPAISEGTGMLVVKRGPNAGSKYLLEQKVTKVGRHPDSDILLDDITVSRRHAEFVPGPEGYLVRDVGSLNGTYLNRERIDEAELTSGDEVQIGKFKLVYLAGHNDAER
ncbi:MAG TPA: FHA domain-containing protein [Acidimicrobiales bacterium]|nr:FHA domain-containing protein [Acidimicrobiales bacterium]